MTTGNSIKHLFGLFFSIHIFLVLRPTGKLAPWFKINPPRRKKSICQEKLENIFAFIFLFFSFFFFNEYKLLWRNILLFPLEGRNQQKLMYNTEEYLVQMDQKGFPTKCVYIQENRLLLLEKTAWLLQGWVFFFFAFNLPIINNQCDLQNNLQKMIGFIIAINYLVRCHQHWDHTIPLTPQHEGFHFCIGNRGTDLQLPWLSWLRFVPTRDLLAAVGHHPHPPSNDSGLQWCRALGAAARLAPGAGGLLSWFQL